MRTIQKNLYRESIRQIDFGCHIPNFIQNPEMKALKTMYMKHNMDYVKLLKRIKTQISLYTLMKGAMCSWLQSTHHQTDKLYNLEEEFLNIMQIINKKGIQKIILLMPLKLITLLTILKDHLMQVLKTRNLYKIF